MNTECWVRWTTSEAMISSQVRTRSHVNRFSLSHVVAYGLVFIVHYVAVQHAWNSICTTFALKWCLKQELAYQQLLHVNTHRSTKSISYFQEFSECPNIGIPDCWQSKGWYVDRLNVISRKASEVQNHRRKQVKWTSIWISLDEAYCLYRNMFENNTVRYKVIVGSSRMGIMTRSGMHLENNHLRRVVTTSCVDNKALQQSERFQQFAGDWKNSTLRYYKGALEGMSRMNILWEGSRTSAGKKWAGN